MLHRPPEDSTNNPYCNILKYFESIGINFMNDKQNTYLHMPVENQKQSLLNSSSSNGNFHFSIFSVRSISCKCSQIHQIFTVSNYIG